MPQTTTAMGPSKMKIEVSSNGTTWSDLGGSLSMIDPDGQERAIGTANVFIGDGPILGYGKLLPVTVKGRGLFTPTTGEAFEVIRAIHETAGGQNIYLRWSPEGGLSTNKQFSTGKGFLQSFKYPGGDADSADPIPFEFTVLASTVVTTALP